MIWLYLSIAIIAIIMFVGVFFIKNNVVSATLPARVNGKGQDMLVKIENSKINFYSQNGCKINPSEEKISVIQNDIL